MSETLTLAESIQITLAVAILDLASNKSFGFALHDCFKRLYVAVIELCSKRQFVFNGLR